MSGWILESLFCRIKCCDRQEDALGVEAEHQYCVGGGPVGSAVRAGLASDGMGERSTIMIPKYLCTGY